MQGIIAGIGTLLAMGAFIATVLWAYSRRRQAEFEALARLPLEEDAQ